MDQEKKETGLERDLSTRENRDFWDWVEKAAEEVDSWPQWKRGGLKPLNGLERAINYMKRKLRREKNKK